jgi:predicted GNAT superfamily acetyltransferase
VQKGAHSPVYWRALVITESQARQEIEYRPCSSLADFAECVRIQHVVWGESISVPVPIFVVAHHTGGQVLGAFQDGRMIGFTQAFTALRAGKSFLHSHVAGVLPQFRDRGVGRRLKLFQREEALRRGIDLIEWTFDPLELKNGYFNLVSLGAIVRRFIPNCYGVTDSPLHAGLPTDRLVAEWWVDSERVKEVLAGRRPALSAHGERIEIPLQLATLRETDRVAAARIQSQAREQFQYWFAKGYAATGVEKRDQATDYLLEPADAAAGRYDEETPPEG